MMFTFDNPYSDIDYGTHLWLLERYSTRHRTDVRFLPLGVDCMYDIDEDMKFEAGIWHEIWANDFWLKDEAGNDLAEVYRPKRRPPNSDPVWNWDRLPVECVHCGGEHGGKDGTMFTLDGALSAASAR